jgi:gliding motility-associated-like protein
LFATNERFLFLFHISLFPYFLIYVEIWSGDNFSDNYSVGSVVLNLLVVNRFLYLILLLVWCAEMHAQADFVENKGQWPEQVKFRAALPSGSIWAEKDCFTFSFFDPKILEYLHPLGEQSEVSSIHRGHSYKLRFVGSTSEFTKGSKPKGFYNNYYLGDNPARWTDHCEVYSKCEYEDLYEGIDLVLYSGNSNVKYDFIVRAGADPDKIKIEFEGADVKLDGPRESAEIVVTTTVNEIREKAPYAYQLIDGKLVEVFCRYELKHQKLSFVLGNFNSDYDLIIDPEIAFSTYIGSAADNFGFTACDDSQGNLISGAAVFEEGYPTTVGAYSSDFATSPNLTMDLGISKFNPEGTQLLYSTYFGGGRLETPHSIVADENDNFIVMGVTGSDDFPTTAGAYNTSFIGGPSLNQSSFFIGMHSFGTDLFLSKFDANGSLMSSTFVGGSHNDGLNNGTQLFYNYGDAFRGEVNIDGNGNVFVATVTRSNDFPMAGNSPQSAYGGGDFDGVLLKMDPTLSNLTWSTFVGGSGLDACYALQFNNTGNIIVAGGTKSADFPFILNGETQTFGGQTDGFISVIDQSFFNVIAGTYVATSSYDQVYFVQVDDDENIYAYGQTAGYMPITPGLYGQDDSGQFLRKYSPDLATLTWNTTIGTGSGEIDISPTAFLVSDCEQIYFSGWGGDVNSNFCDTHPCEADFSTTSGLPITSDAFQSTTDGSDFYLCVLNPNASGLLYASFLGGSSSAEHVDGGTSRFDKNGSVYQAVCAGCHDNDDFPTTPGVWSATNNSTGCNLAVFRFDLNSVIAEVAIDGPDEVCFSQPISFINQTIGASTYLWSFGDGETSDVFEPTHIFEEPGDYTIRLIGMDDELCVNADTAYVTLTILAGVDPSIEAVDPICLGDEVQLAGSGTENLQWMFSISLSNIAIPDPVASPNVTTTYTLIDENECEVDSAFVTVVVNIPQTDISDNATICIGENTQFVASGGSAYSWSPSAGLNNSAIANPVCTPLVTTTYTVTIISTGGCPAEEEVTVNVVNNSPGSIIYDPITMCEGTAAQLIAGVGTTWEWTPSSTLSNGFIQNPVATPQDTTIYSVFIINACGQGTDFVTVNVIHPNVVADGGGYICPGKNAPAKAVGGVEYFWQPILYAEPHDADSTTLTPPETMWFTVTGVDEFNCYETDSVFVYVFPRAEVDAGPDQYFEFPGSASLIGNTFDLPFYWWPEEGLSCVDCIYPVASPEVETWYHLAVIDDQGCVSDDSVFVKPYHPIYVPNTLTPNGDGINDVFKAYGINIEGFHMRIFDRWGMKVFESYDIEEVWTGGFHDGDYYVQNDVYNWIIEFDSIDRRKQLSGHVTMVR